MYRLLNKKSIRDRNKPAFWITNITNKNVCLRDLAITIPAWTTMNLLDDKHYNYTEEQLENSARNGSIAIKSKKIKIRKEAPQFVVEPGIQLYKGILTRNKRTAIETIVEKYEELDMTDEEFANNFSGPNTEEKEEETN